MLRRLYDRVLALSASRYAPLWLAVIAFAESSFFPIPPDVLLIPMVLARPHRAWLLATICTVASVVGGALGYYIGYALFNQVARRLIEIYGFGPRLADYQAIFADYGFRLILLKGLLPVPYKIITIASGAAKFSFPLFMLASVITRGARFFLLAALLRKWGEPIRDLIERRLTLVASLVAVGIIGGFLAVKLL